MERINPLQDSALLIGEHLHRYRWVSRFAYGNLCDLACGMGYGSTVMIENPNVLSYVGIDLSEEAIAFAKANYERSGVRFMTGSCDAIPLPDDSMDTFISLETLEHLPEPELAIKEYERVLKADGVLIGSVPTALYEDVCTNLYGKNPYHVQAFTEEALRELLASSFSNVRIYCSTLEVISSITGENDRGDHAGARHANFANSQLGSYLFIASNRADFEEMLEQKGIREAVEIESLLPLTEYDRAYVASRNQTIETQARMIDERDALIRRQDELVLELKGTIADQAKLVDERDELIRQQDAWIASLKQTIEDQAKLVDERDELIRQQDASIASLKQTIEDQAKLGSLFSFMRRKK